VYVKGSSKNIEYKKPDHSFYRGIVIDDQDPNKLMRVKVFIPELSNQPYEDWLSDFNNGIQTMIYPGSIGPLSKVNTDTLTELIPWAEQMAPLMGESGTSHYFASKGEQISKATYVGTATQSKVPSDKSGGSMGRVTIATDGADCADAWVDGKLGKANVTGGAYAPKNSGPESSGVYGTPQVGAHVWVFHYRGDLNYPVYFGTSSSYRDTALVYGKGESYPAGHGSNTGNSPDVEDTQPSSGSGTTGAVNASGFRSTVYATAYEGGTPENPRGNGIPLDTTTRWETDTSAEGRERRQRYNLRQIPVQWQFIGNANNQLVAGRSIAVDSQQIKVWPRGTILRINGDEFEVADTAGRPGVIDFYAGNSRQRMNRFENFKIETIEVVRVGS
tara:strand:- start:47 stop:1210 length:1164 start_codon:yes stop_codon:yes gene_type:complete